MVNSKQKLLDDPKTSFGLIEPRKVTAFIYKADSGLLEARLKQECLGNRFNVLVAIHNEERGRKL